MRVFPFIAAHTDCVAGLIVGIQRGEFGIPITLEQQPDLADIPGFYQTGAGGFWVAVDGAAVVGTIALKDIGGRQGALRKMFVAASHRGGAGVARALLESLLAHARQSGLTEIYLGTTDKFLAAHRFYEKHDFAPVAAEHLPPTFPRMAVDSRFYRLEM